VVFRRLRFFQGRERPNGLKDVTWVRPDGGEMSSEDWSDPERRTLAFVLSGEPAGDERTRAGEPASDDTFFAVLHAGPEPQEQVLPDGVAGRRWACVFDTAQPEGPEGVPRDRGEKVRVEGRSFVLFVARPA